MTETRAVRWLLRIATMVVLAFIYVPLLVVAVYAFNESNIQTWPISGVSLRWFERALADGSIREAFVNSLLAAIGATAIALVLGTLAQTRGFGAAFTQDQVRGPARPSGRAAGSAKIGGPLSPRHPSRNQG